MPALKKTAAFKNGFCLCFLSVACLGKRSSSKNIEQGRERGRFLTSRHASASSSSLQKRFLSNFPRLCLS
eukprot:SAG22_NODE_102_length_20195_cov_3.248308_5_plen_70_part_00